MRSQGCQQLNDTFQKYQEADSINLAYQFTLKTLTIPFVISALLVNHMDVKEEVAMLTFKKVCII